MRCCAQRSSERRSGRGLKETCHDPDRLAANCALLRRDRRAGAAARRLPPARLRPRAPGPVAPARPRVCGGARAFLSPARRPVEGVLYRLGGVDATREQHWTTYTVSMLLFHA